MLSLNFHYLATWIPRQRAVVFSKGSICCCLHTCIWPHKTQEEKSDYCANYNRGTVYLASPSSSHCYQNAIEETRIYCQLLQLFIFCQTLQGKYFVNTTLCLMLYPDVHDGTAWQRWLTLPRISPAEEAGSWPCLLAHLGLPINEKG